MWQRFTERARRVVFFAQEEAGRFGASYISTEHALLGLVRENNTVAARILDRIGISLTEIRAAVEREMTQKEKSPGNDLQLTPRMKRVIDLAYDEATKLGNPYIGTEHLLLGLIREGEGLAGRVLQKLGANLERTRREVTLLQNEMPDTEHRKKILTTAEKEVIARNIRGKGLEPGISEDIIAALKSVAEEVINREGAESALMPIFASDFLLLLGHLPVTEVLPPSPSSE